MMAACPGLATVAIEEALVTDATELLSLQRLAYQSEAELYGDPAIPPLTQTVGELEAEFGEMVILKATAGGRIIGSVRAREEPGTCRIGRLIVHPDYQNQGIGSRLMSAIEERFGRVQRFELFTGHRSTRNLHLYHKLGYRPYLRRQLSDRVQLVFLEKENSGLGGSS